MVQKATDTSDREIVTVRVFDAPRELVFAAWTDPKHVAKWWGPKGFTTTTSEMDVRPDGVWRFVMHGPDGTDYKNKIVYKVVSPPERLEYHHAGEDETADVHFFSVVTFEDEGGKTRLTMRAVFPTIEAKNHAVVHYKAVEGGKQTLGRLGEYLDAGREIVSTRVVKAPPAAVFAAFCDPARLARWWGPEGFTNTFEAFDPRPGGDWKFVMHGPDGKNYPNESVFEEIVEPKRIVFVHLGTMHKFRMTMTFDEHDGGTMLTWRMLFDTAEECGRVKAFAGPANEQNFDRLEANLGLK